MITLKNEQLEVHLENKGAEIIKIIGQQDHINYIWKRDPILWGSSAPILFPIVGAVRNGQYTMDGQTYEMKQHGFARHCQYTSETVSDSEVIFTLTSNEEIKKQYPCLFELKVIYTLDKNILSCKCVVKNVDTKNILFQIGGHPAFACPFNENESSNDYYLEFSQKETLDQKIINVEKAAMSHDTVLLLDDEQRFFIRQKMFDNDAIVVKDFKSETISLKSINHNKSIVFHMEGFNHLGLWASNHVGGLLAIEPWVGHNDYVDFCGEFKDKEGVVELTPNQEFTCTFKVEVNQ